MLAAIVALVAAVPAPDPARAAVTICLAPASAQMATNNSADAVEAVRQTFTSFLSGPTISTTPLSARLAIQAREEAKQVGCQFVLYATVRHQRKAGSGFMGRIAGSMAQSAATQVSGGGLGASAVRAAATAAADAAGSLAANTRERDEMSLTYRLEDATGKTVLEHTGRRKASADGEDLLTPLVEPAAEAVAGVATKAGERPAPPERANP